MRRTLSGTGRLLITLGLLILLFVGYQLWGTNILQARAQNELESEFEDLQETYAALRAGGPATDAPTTTQAPTTTTTSPDDPTLAGDGEVDLSELPQFELGDPLGHITIPEAGVDQFFVVGVGRDELKKGPGHYPGTPLPGSAGVAAIAGHRTTYGAPFFDINELQVADDPENAREDRRGDLVVTETLAGNHAFEVITQIVVKPNETWVAAPIDQPIDRSAPQTRTNWQEFVRDLHTLWGVPAPTLPNGDPRWTDENGDALHLDPDGSYLVLTSCNPRYSAAERIVIFAKLITDEDDDRKRGDAVNVSLPGGSGLISDLPGFEDAPSFEEGLGGDPASIPPAIL